MENKKSSFVKASKDQVEERTINQKPGMCLESHRHAMQLDIDRANYAHQLREPQQRQGDETSRLPSHENHLQLEQKLIETLIIYHKQYSIPLPVGYDQPQSSNPSTPNSEDSDVSTASHYEYKSVIELNKLYTEIERSRTLVDQITKNIKSTEIMDDSISKDIRKGTKAITHLADTAEALSLEEYKTLKSQLDSIEEEHKDKKEADSIKFQYINDYVDNLYSRRDELKEVYNDLIHSLRRSISLYDKIQLSNNDRKIR